MGMMERLTERDRELISQAVEGVALNDIGKIQDAVLALGEFKGKPDHSKLYQDIQDLMENIWNCRYRKYRSCRGHGSILMEVMKENKIMMPHGLTMLARGLTHVEGVLADISPEINMVQIAAARIKEEFFGEGNWKKELRANTKNICRPSRNPSKFRRLR